MVFVVAAVLIAVAFLSSRLLPRALHGRSWIFAHPRAGLALWTASLLLGVAALTAAMAYVVAAALRMAASPATTPLNACDCVNAAGIYVLGWLLTAVVGGVGSLAIYSGACRAIRNWNLRHEVAAALLMEAEGALIAGEEVMVYPHTSPLALGVPGRHRLVAVSESLRGRLDETELAAVLTHERAHLRQHHALLTQLASMHSACVPRTRGARNFESAVRILVELAADDAAARRHGVVVTASALRKASDLDASMALRAARLELRRRSGAEILDQALDQAERDRDLIRAAAPASRPSTPATRPA